MERPFTVYINFRMTPQKLHTREICFTPVLGTNTKEIISRLHIPKISFFYCRVVVVVISYLCKSHDLESSLQKLYLQYYIEEGEAKKTENFLGT